MKKSRFRGMENEKKSWGVKEWMVVVMLLASCACGKDHYQVLGVGKKATQKQIKKAYKKLIVKYHPDRNKKREKWAKNQFIQVSNAYEVLSDPEKRKIYDQFGDEGIKNFEQHGNAHGAGGGFGGFGGGGGMNIEDIIGAFFGGGGGGGGRGGGRQQRRRRRRDRGQRQRQRQRSEYRREYSQEEQYGNSDGFEFRSGDDGENFGQQKETKKVLQHEHFIEIESEDMLPDFDSLTDSYGLFMYKPQHVKQSRKGSNAGLVMAEKLQSLVEKFGSFLKVGLLNCETFEVACGRLHAKVGSVNPGAPMYTVFGHLGKFKTLSLDRPDLKLNRIVSTHVNLMQKNVVRLTEKTLPEFVNANVNKNIVTLFTNKPKPSLLFLTLANIFRDKYIFTEVHVSEKSLFEKFGVDVKKVPRLMVMKDLVSFEGWTYEGDLKKKLLIIFLSQKLKQLKEESKKVGVFSKAQLESGQCGVKDSSFCLLVLSNSPGNDKWLLERLNKVARNYSSDPLKIFLFNDKQKFAEVFGDNKIVFMKAKRRKFKGKDQGLWQLQDQQLRDFIDMGMSGGMLQGRFKTLEHLF
jgi:curved DNA-binding protein CbpA